MGSSTRELICHPAAPASSIHSVTVEVERQTAGLVWVRYHVEAPLDLLVLPYPCEAMRADGLWTTTCFELFVRANDVASYTELNFSPSSQWAAYLFTGERTGVRELELSAAPDIGNDASGSHFALEASFALPISYSGLSLNIGLSAVIEESDGTKSYWALRHPPGKPDFHHRDCFALALPAPDAP